MKKIWFWVVLLAGAALLLLGSYYVLTEVIFGPSAIVKSAMQSDAAVKVEFLESKSWMVMTPINQPIRAGLLMYPENYQDIRMYAPVLRRISEAGYQVVIVARRGKYSYSPVEESKRIAKILDTYSQVENWFIGAHSWETNAIAVYLTKPDPRFRGVILWGGRVYAESDISGTLLPVMNIYGTLDDQNENLLKGNQPFLPANVQIEWIDGGNRTNFADFGPLSRDVGASIPREEQQKQTAEYTIQFMEENLP